MRHYGEEKFNFIFEPGRLIAADAGILVSKVLYTKISEGKKFIIIEGSELNYNSNFKKQTSALSSKLLSNFKYYLDIKIIQFDTSVFESLDVLNLAKIICVISPLDYLTKQMLLEFNNSNDLCHNLISVLEIEISNIGKNSRIN